MIPDHLLNAARETPSARGYPAMRSLFIATCVVLVFNTREVRVLAQAIPEFDLHVYPSQILLDDPLSRQQIIVMGKDGQGMARDWTRSASAVIADASIAEIRGGVVFPLAEGSTELLIEVADQQRILPITVSQQSQQRGVHFESEVLVALSKQGCNSGACHGSPTGKGGFRLSLRAYDPPLDQMTLIREDFGRRVNPLEPDESLLLKKPLMQVGHGGGKQLYPDDAAYSIVRDWISGGAEADPVETPRVRYVEVFPDQKQVLPLAGGTQQLAATAHFSDGSSRDVTHLVAYESSDNKVASVDAQGLVTPHLRGEVVILVRFLEHIESVPLMFVQEQPGFDWDHPTPRNYIDTLVLGKLEQMQYLAAAKCDDSEFIRRVSLDVLGILPTIAETENFLADHAENKRERLIDALLAREEYAKFWALKWGDLLRITHKRLGEAGVREYHRWLEDSFRNNVPYDRFARELITASGSTLVNPPANFYLTAGDMAGCVETVSQVFLGARLQCAKCHNHPFERWTQDNYFGLGAFFNRVERHKVEDSSEILIDTSSTDEVKHPRTGKVMRPWLPQVGSVDVHADTDRRSAFADWLVDQQNPYFARIEANRIWSQFFSRGIVDPIDDFRDSNPPSNAPLLDALAENFAASGFDRKHLIRAILNSNTYQASCAASDFNSEDRTYFSRQEPRLLKAEQLLDAINQTLGLSEDFEGLPMGTLATHLPAPDMVENDFLKNFGQPDRSTVCACERSVDSNLTMAIEMFNGTSLHEKLRDENSRFRRSLAAGRSLEEVIGDLFLAAISRPPTETEMSAAIDHCKTGDEPAVGMEDICWALFNTDEFLFQH